MSETQKPKLEYYTPLSELTVNAHREWTLQTVNWLSAVQRNIRRKQKKEEMTAEDGKRYYKELDLLKKEAKTITKTFPNSSQDGLSGWFKLPPLMFNSRIKPSQTKETEEMGLREEEGEVPETEEDLQTKELIQAFRKKLLKTAHPLDQLWRQGSSIATETGSGALTRTTTVDSAHAATSLNSSDQSGGVLSRYEQSVMNDTSNWI